MLKEWLENNLPKALAVATGIGVLSTVVCAIHDTIEAHERHQEIEQKKSGSLTTGKVLEVSGQGFKATAVSCAITITLIVANTIISSDIAREREFIIRSYYSSKLLDLVEAIAEQDSDSDYGTSP